MAIIMSYTIFDTNAYREYTYNKNISGLDAELADLVSIEKSKNIQSLANPFVMLELTSHLANTTDLAYKNCLHSVYAQGARVFYSCIYDITMTVLPFPVLLFAVL